MTLKIYTKTGDEGTTGSLEGIRYRKNDTVIEIIGLIDETIISIQKARYYFKDEALKKQWDKIIEALYLLGAEISNAKASGLSKYIVQGFVEKLEEKIDEYYIKTNSFQYFVQISAIECEEARVRVRKLERGLTILLRHKQIRPTIYSYINRLSDYIFVMSVYAEKNIKD